MIRFNMYLVKDQRYNIFSSQEDITNKLLVIITILLLVTGASCINVYLPPGVQPTPTVLPTPVPTPTPTPAVPPANARPLAYIDNISPVVGMQGVPVYFNGHGTDQDGFIVAYEWRSNLDGILSAAQSFTTGTLSNGVHTVFFRVQDNKGLWSEAVTGTVTINPKPAQPSIVSFSATPQNVAYGNAFVLSWNVSGATQISIDNGIGPVSSTGSRTVYPTMNTLYTLTAINQGGNATASVLVSVIPSQIFGDPLINFFTAQYLGGTSWQLRWSVSYATTIRIDPDIGFVDDSGTVVVNALMPRTYTLTATNSWGWSRYYVSLGYQ
jgi:hypothetical protein